MRHNRPFHYRDCHSRSNRDRNDNRSGQTLVEAVVVIGMVVLLVSGLIVGTTASIRASERGKQRAQAVKYAQEAIEYARNLRNTGWQTFQSQTGDWCLDKSQVRTEAASGICPINVDTLFRRKLTLTWNDPQMDVTSTVSWNDGSGDHKSELVTYFTQWR